MDTLKVLSYLGELCCSCRPFHNFNGILELTEETPHLVSWSLLVAVECRWWSSWCLHWIGSIDIFGVFDLGDFGQVKVRRQWNRIFQSKGKYVFFEVDGNDSCDYYNTLVTTWVSDSWGGCFCSSQNCVDQHAAFSGLSVLQKWE